jgi:hypothetical protein
MLPSEMMVDCFQARRHVIGARKAVLIVDTGRKDSVFPQLKGPRLDPPRLEKLNEDADRW